MGPGTGSQNSETKGPRGTRRGKSDNSMIDVRTLSYPYGRKKETESLLHNFHQSPFQMHQGLKCEM